MLKKREEDGLYAADTDYVKDLDGEYRRFRIDCSRPDYNFCVTLENVRSYAFPV